MRKLIGISFVSLFLMVGVTQAKAWKKIAEEDNIQVYTVESEKGVMPFKAVGEIDANIEDLLKILQDMNKKHLWSPKLKSVKVHKEEAQQSYLFSEYYKTPWPSVDREFLLHGTLKKKSPTTYLLSAKSIENENLEDDGHVQADVKKLDLILTSLGPNKTNISFEFHGDLKGWIPTWLMNLIQKKWPLRFIQGLRKRIHEI